MSRVPYQTTQYLLGLSSTPPLTQQELAVAQLQAGLNSGMFDPAHPNWRQESPPPLPPKPELLLRVNILEKLPSRKDKVQPMTVRIEVNIDHISPGQFLQKMYHELRKDNTSAKLVYRTCDDNRNAWKPLRSEDDALEALKAATVLLRKLTEHGGRRKAEVYLDVANSAEPEPAPTPAAAPKPSETAYGRELELVKTKLSCAEHGGRNRWCYVRQAPHPQAGEHVPLAIEHVTLWARKLHENECDADCVTPPNTLNLDEAAQRNASVRRNKTSTGQPQLPAMHFHFGGSEGPAILGERGENAHSIAGTSQVGEKRKRAASEDEDDDLDIYPIPIHDILVMLDGKMPDLQYLQYEPALLEQGIAYIENALSFCSTPEFFADKKTVGMVPGAIQPFVKAVRRRYQQEARAAKCRCLEDENVAPM